ncbi:hypothetical protein J6590_047691 [Homalodisca vitripennis]|nr:hypothetical protein J6590_047691 [Homalodisca vitripennis]
MRQFKALQIKKNYAMYFNVESKTVYNKYTRNVNAKKLDHHATPSRPSAHRDNTFDTPTIIVQEPRAN